MGIKRFIVFGGLFLLAIGIYVYYFIDNDTKTLTLYGLEYFKIPNQFNILNAIWIILPAAILYIFTITHLLFYFNLKSRAEKKILNDQNSINDLLVQKILKKQNVKKLNFKTNYFNTIREFVENINGFELGKSINIKESKINHVVKSLSLIDKGEVAEEKFFKTNKISNQNQLYVQNELNKLEIDPLYADKYIRHYTKIQNQDIKIKVTDIAVKSKDIKVIKKLKLELTKEQTFKILEKTNTREDFLLFVNQEIFEQEDFVSIVKKFKSKFTPSVMIEIFTELSRQNEKAYESLIYTHFEYEQLDIVEDLIQNRYEYMKYTLLLKLKKSGEHFDINMFI